MTCSSKEEATRQGKKLLKMMKSKGWRLVVHENLGWFYTLHQGNELTGYLSVHADYNGALKNFSCLISTSVSGAGEMMWSDQKTFDDPNDAVSHAVKMAEYMLEPYKRAVQFGKNVVMSMKIRGSK